MNKKIIYIAIILAIIIAYYVWSSNTESSEEKKEEVIVNSEKADRIKILKQQYVILLNNYCYGRSDCVAFGAELMRNIDWGRVYDEERAGINTYLTSVNLILTSNY